ncbi:MAG TPA: hypoxanthine phosphoribosyltransferase [Actinomycetota bacterium]|nr:hypoxanthine phosphoribosyltransferase [Actinomycetota bacterium]
MDEKAAGPLIPAPHSYSEDLGEIIVTGDEIQAKVAELGRLITEDYAGRSPILVGVLKGAFILMADLARNIQLPVRFDFMAVSSYGSATKTSGVVRILKDLDNEIEDQDVLLVEDIIDSGLTLKYLLRYLGARRPASLEVCALFRKESDRAVEVPVRYEGFRIPSDFVVGYGLDHAERFRNLPFLALLKPGIAPEQS